MAIFGPDAQATDRHVRSGRRRGAIAGLHAWRSPNAGASRTHGPDRQDARHRQRGLAVPDAARARTGAGGASTPRRARRKCSPAASAATSWRRSGSAAPTSPRSGSMRSTRTTASRPASTPPRFAAIPARRTACTGRPPRAAAQPARRSAAQAAPIEPAAPRRGRRADAVPRLLLPDPDAQGAAAPGGARNYVVNGELTGGFALVAWPAQYDVTGIMTFIVNQDGVVSQKDLGPDTDAAARAISTYDPDSTWAPSSRPRPAADLKARHSDGTKRTQARGGSASRATARERRPWRQWGPYLSERQWGTVREDYSDSGDAWNYFTPRPGALARLPLGRGRPRRHLRRPAAALLRARALERQRSDPQGAAVRADQQRGQSRRGRQGVLLLSRLDADALVHEVPVQVPAGGVSLRRPRRDQPAARPPRARVRAARHRRLRRGPLLRRVRRVREGVARGHPDPDHACTTAAPRRPTLHVLPTLWFRNTWSWQATADRPAAAAGSSATAGRVVRPSHPELGERYLLLPTATPPLLFTENETNTERLFGAPNRTPVREGRHQRLRRPRPARTR